MKKLKSSNGITLIALIITIVVLLILAGVSINMVIGENGLINKAKSAVDTYQNSAEEEQVFLNEIENYIAGGLANIDSIGGGTPPTPMPVATVGKITTANSTINGEAYSDKNPIIPANFKAKNDGAAWDAASGPEVTKGLVITDDTNEFVWIPVADINSMVMCQTHGASKTLTVNETTGEVTCPTCSAESKATKLAGKLYIFPGTTTITATVIKDTELREPDNLKSSPEADAASRFTDASLKTNWTNATYQTEFDKMVKSVAKYKGFYVGRYETSMNGSTAQSKAGVTPMNNINWWRMYENSRTMAASYSNLESSMIWGCQWDAMMRFILTGSDASHVTASNNVAHSGLSAAYATGSEPADKASNIYDLEGNVREWTQEANLTRHRVIRGGCYFYRSDSPSDRDDCGIPTDPYDDIGSRATLYVV